MLTNEQCITIPQTAAVNDMVRAIYEPVAHRAAVCPTSAEEWNAALEEAAGFVRAVWTACM